METRVSVCHLKNPAVPNDYLLQCIRQYPYLYQRKHPKFNETKFKEATWKKISKVLNTPVSLVKNRWKSLRDQHSRFKRRRLHSSSGEVNKWRYADAMTFLDGNSDEESSNEDDASEKGIKNRNNEELMQPSDTFEDKEANSEECVAFSPAGFETYLVEDEEQVLKQLEEEMDSMPKDDGPHKDEHSSTASPTPAATTLPQPAYTTGRHSTFLAMIAEKMDQLSAEHLIRFQTQMFTAVNDLLLQSAGRQ